MTWQLAKCLEYFGNMFSVSEKRWCHYMYHNWRSRQYFIFCCAFIFPCLLICRKFLIRASHHPPFVHNSFYYQLYIIINIQRKFVSTKCFMPKIRLSLATQHHYCRDLSSCMCLSTFKYLNSTILLMLKVNISWLKFYK